MRLAWTLVVLGLAFGQPAAAQDNAGTPQPPSGGFKNFEEYERAFLQSRGETMDSDPAPSTDASLDALRREIALEQLSNSLDRAARSVLTQPNQRQTTQTHCQMLNGGKFIGDYILDIQWPRAMT